MLYTELLKLWDEAVKALDARDWRGALAKLDDIYEPTARTLFVAAAAHLALGQLQAAIQVLKLIHNYMLFLGCAFYSLGF